MPENQPITTPGDVTPFKGIQRRNKNKHEVTDIRLTFCYRLIAHGNISRASREVGINSDTGQTWLKLPEIKAKIQEIQQEKLRQYEVSAERVIEELARIAFANIDDFMTIEKDGTPVIDFSRVSRQELAAVAEITQDRYYEMEGDVCRTIKKTKIKLSDKQAALIALAKKLDLFPAEKRELSGPNGGPISVSFLDDILNDDSTVDVTAVSASSIPSPLNRLELPDPDAETQY